METSIYYDKNIIQVVLTPENSFEKEIMEKLEDKKLDTELFYGSFGNCNGGWQRLYNSENGNSLIIRVSDKK